MKLEFSFISSIAFTTRAEKDLKSKQDINFSKIFPFVCTGLLDSVEHTAGSTINGSKTGDDLYLFIFFFLVNPFLLAN